MADDAPYARKKIEILYHDVLGEVDTVVARVEAVVARVEALKDDFLPTIVDGTKDELSAIVGTLVAAGKNYQAALQEGTNKVSAGALSDLRREAELFKKDLLGQVGKEVRLAVDQPAADLVKDLRRAVDRANSNQGRTLWLALAVGVASSLITAFVVLISVHYLSDFHTETPVQVAPIKKGK